VIGENSHAWIVEQHKEFDNSNATYGCLFCGGWYWGLYRGRGALWKSERNLETNSFTINIKPTNMLNMQVI
jgi:hypothetical protein